MPPGTARFQLYARVDAFAPVGTVISNGVEVSSDADPNPANNAATVATSVVAGSADTFISRIEVIPNPARPGEVLNYIIVGGNNGPSLAAGAQLIVDLPFGTSFESIAPNSNNWFCTPPPEGTVAARISCLRQELPVGLWSLAFVARVLRGVPDQAVLPVSAVVFALTPDPTPADRRAAGSVTVRAVSRLSATKSVAGKGLAGDPAIYTIKLRNIGTGTQSDNPGPELVDTLPKELSIVDAGASSGAVAIDTAANRVSWNGQVASGGEVTITISTLVRPGVRYGTVIENQAMTSSDADGDGTNETSAASVDSTTGAGPTRLFAGSSSPAPIPALQWPLLALSVLMLVVIGIIWRPRRSPRSPPSPAPRSAH
jgi:uncharacterized repeat protein (TIGR01451 family)